MARISPARKARRVPGATSPATSQLHGQRPPTFKHLGRQLTIEYRPIAALVPYANNPRTHSDRQSAKIAASIRTFGFTKPILTDGSEGVIAGRGRIEAAQLLGMETVPTIRLEHLSEAQRRAHVVADNRRRSLSAIAQTIAGTGRNRPAFFGLRGGANDGSA